MHADVDQASSFGDRRARSSRRRDLAISPSASNSRIRSGRFRMSAGSFRASSAAVAGGVKVPSSRSSRKNIRVGRVFPCTPGFTRANVADRLSVSSRSECTWSMPSRRRGSTKRSPSLPRERSAVPDQPGHRDVHPAQVRRAMPATPGTIARVSGDRAAQASTPFSGAGSDRGGRWTSRARWRDRVADAATALLEYLGTWKRNARRVAARQRAGADRHVLASLELRANGGSPYRDTVRQIGDGCRARRNDALRVRALCAKASARAAQPGPQGLREAADRPAQPERIDPACGCDAGGSAAVAATECRFRGRRLRTTRATRASGAANPLRPGRWWGCPAGRCLG